MKLHKQLSWTSRFSLALVASIAVIILYCKIGTTSKDTQLQSSAGSLSQHRLLQWVKANGGTVRRKGFQMKAVKHFIQLYRFSREFAEGPYIVSVDLGQTFP